jgi:two-component system invasion response regulator UvrY
MTYEILIADDHAIIRDGLKKIIADTEDLKVVDEACNGSEVLQKVRAREYALIILDMSMPGRNGLELIKLIKSERPKQPILIFSMHPEEQYAVRALRVGASGYLSKEADSDLLVPATRKVAQGGVFISTKVAELLAIDKSLHAENPSHMLLTDREFEIFSRIVAGVSLTDIAHELSLSVKTVSTHKSNILGKMNLHSDVELVRYALQNSLIN